MKRSLIYFNLFLGEMYLNFFFFTLYNKQIICNQNYFQVIKMIMLFCFVLLKTHIILEY